MGEETEMMTSEDVAAAEGVTADEPGKMPRKRKNRLYKALKDLMEFYLGDVNLSKNRFMAQKINGQPFVYVDLSVFLTFNKVKALTSNITDIAKALKNSEILQVSDDGTQVCRKTPIKKKENEMDCTIYVEQLGPDVDHDWLVKVFSEFGPVDYVSLPRFPHNNKLKGFAFVEFRDPEGAKKALEAFCCLPPTLSPEELLSIKSTGFEKKNKKKKKGRKQENLQNYNEVSDSQNLNVVDENFSGNENWIGRKNKYRPGEESDEMGTKKIKPEENKHIYFGDDEGNVEKHYALENESESFLEKNNLKERESDTVSNKEEKNNSQTDEKSQRKKKKRKHSADEITNQDCDSSKEEKSEEQPPIKKKAKSDTRETENLELDGNDQPHKKKRKHSTDESIDHIAELIKVEKNEEDEEEEQPIKKKAKLETDAEETLETEENTENSAKKKRRKRTKIKKEKISATSLGLKVLPKKEWQLLRNKYLAMQREMMSSLKKHLHDSPMERHRPAPPEKKFEGPPKGTVIKVILDEPVTNCKASKSELRINPEISYIDVTEGSPCVYLRTKTPETATNLVQAKPWPNMAILQGEEEAAYWTKMKKDREYHQSKHKPNHRGRTKLLKRAEMFQGKHMTSFDTV